MALKAFVSLLYNFFKNKIPFLFLAYLSLTKLMVVVSQGSGVTF